MIICSLLLRVYGNLLYFSAVRSQLECLDVLQCQAADICHDIFLPWNHAGSYAAVVELMCGLLDGEGCGHL